MMQKRLAALALSALMAFMPALGLPEGDYDAGALTSTVAGVTYNYGNQINVTLTFDGQPDGKDASRRAEAAASLLEKSELQLSFYDDYGTGRIHAVYTLDDIDLFEGTLLLPEDGSIQLQTNLTGNYMLTMPAGTRGKTTNFQDLFYGSLVRRRTDISLSEMSAHERLRATASDVLILVFNHLLGWTSERQREREDWMADEEVQASGEEVPLLYAFDDTFFEETPTRDPVSQRMVGTVYAHQFTELLWNIMATIDAEMGDFQQAIADCLAEAGVTQRQTQEFADRLMPDIRIDPATDYVTPTHALRKPEDLCTKRNVSYIFKKLVKLTDKWWEGGTDNILSLIVSYDSNGRMVGFDATLPQFTECLPTEGNYSWSLHTDEYGQTLQTITGALKLTDSLWLKGDVSLNLGRDVGGVCDSRVAASVDLVDNDGQGGGLGLDGRLTMELAQEESGGQAERLTGECALTARENGASAGSLLNGGLEGRTVTLDGTSFTTDAALTLAAENHLTVTMNVRADTSSADELSQTGGQALSLANLTAEELDQLKDTVRGKAMGMLPKLMLHPSVLNDLSKLIAR